ncbi:DUF5916 domain-containing protein [Fulvivirga sedimenti]|uniref:Carbohydrate binding family 9 domain-containing protein n=1 Tax=Fulvivirga sedimenti TaxID=2879465 RepID=A0A9X1HWI6_9BACT|nr:DUF5916 domain-containing protein [Fulvivirga sedimenti]MCA6078941.1 carbohydrate binding family 9 domain-containing protein [Fulvivirga sedimenti]
MKYYLICKTILLSLFSVTPYAQGLNIRPTSEPMVIDGIMNEEVWVYADVATDFMQNFPYDSSLANAQTEVRVTYDDQNLYVLAIMHNLGPREYIVPSLRRDFRGSAFDSFSILLDTYKDKTNAFLFGVNPEGVQREGLISNGGNGEESLSLTWDNKWYAAAKIYDDYWMAEIAIPFKTLRFKEGMESWLMNFYRIDSEYAERSTWSPIPRNFSILNLAYNRELRWDRPLESPGKNISLIPFTSFRTVRDFENETSPRQEFDFGGDAKVAISSSLNLDLTVNPDFSQVEADQQVTNLDRFEIFFPERRQFFQENDDLFSDFGTGGTRPFFSRRIGVTRDTSTGSNVQNRLYGGARMSGNINNKWRVGLMSIQAAKDESIGLPSVNYSVASVQHRIGQRSNISGIFVNKQAFRDSLGAEFNLGPDQWNRTAGLDLNLATPDNTWSGKAYYHRSFEPDSPDSAYSYGLGANYTTFRWEANTDFFAVGANFNPEVGFVRRTDFMRSRATVYHNFYPSSGPIQSHAPGLDYDITWNQQYGTTDWDVNVLYRINFRNTSNLRVRLRREFVYLFSSFDPSGTGGEELPADTDYSYNMVIASYSSDQRKNFFFDISTRSGAYFNGSRFNVNGTLTYRFGKQGNVSMNVTYNRIRLPDPYNDANLLLVGPRFDITFTKSLFWTTFIQYNEQINNVNINSRLQWRFKPVSDLFIVYTDNYFAAVDGRFVDFTRPKSRALVIKLSYWFNL